MFLIRFIVRVGFVGNFNALELVRVLCAFFIFDCVSVFCFVCFGKVLLFYRYSS